MENIATWFSLHQQRAIITIGDVTTRLSSVLFYDKTKPVGVIFLILNLTYGNSPAAMALGIQTSAAEMGLSNDTGGWITDVYSKPTRAFFCYNL